MTSAVDIVVSKQDVETIISRTLDFQQSKILEYHLEPFSKNVTGILATHLLLTVRVTSQGDDGSKTLTYFVKTLPDPVIQKTVMDTYVFLEEINFYSKIFPLMSESYRGKSWSPKCYLTNDSVLIFEDLRSQGYLLRDNFLLDESSLKLAVAAVARFHAASFALEARLGQRIDQVYPEAFVEKVYNKTNKFGRGSDAAYEAIVWMAEKFGADSSLVPKVYQWVYQHVRARDSKLNVICHSDMWQNNLLFNDTEQKCLLVDFQLLRYASFAVDLRMLLHIQTTPETRKKWEAGLLRQYYSTLKDTLALTEGHKVKVPEYEDIWSEYCELGLVGVTYALTYVPGIGMESDDFEELMNDPVKIEKWFYKNRFNLIKSNIDKSPAYEELLRKHVVELFEEAGRVLV